MDRALRLWVTVGIVLALATTAFMGFLSWHSTVEAADYAAWVAHTQAVKNQLDLSMRHVVDVETGARAYYVTRDERFLRPYVDGIHVIDSDLDTLRRLVADNPVQTQRLGLLRLQIATKLELSAAMVRAARNEEVHFEKALFVESKQRMDLIRATVQEMQSEELLRLDQRAPIAEHQRRQTRMVAVAGTAVGAILLLIAGATIYREINKSALARSQLAALNHDLEKHVEERTSDLKATELSLLNQTRELTRSEREVRRFNQELEQRVHERTADLESANKELEAFTYSVSHDLRAPLRHIAGFSRMLAEECGTQLTPEAQRLLQRIQDGTQRMGVLVDDLLNLARIGRHELRLQVTGLEKIIRELIADFQFETTDRVVEWKVAQLPFVECDPALLKQVFQNLLSNALKYSRPRSPAIIEIGMTGTDAGPAIFVRDNGVGFNMKYADKLFGVFQRLHRSEDFEGTGVGLAIVHRIVQKHGGRIWVEAELDKGATFYLVLGAVQEGELNAKSATAGRAR